MSFDADHRLYHDLLPQYAAGTLPLETQQRIATHLETCVACREALSGWQAIRAGLRRELAE
ncbi:MAG TPA: zf-HC2 domain-containing protein, partial [Ktedonobacterales bacterium]|nr:zf-HC2 domain-containing protein [Ktedonobacterales bacterium]